MPNRERDCPWGEGDFVVFSLGKKGLNCLSPKRRELVSPEGEAGTKLPFPKEDGVGFS
jgi:hypothetical protein